ncbi:hypothetical protein [Microvirga yunnanensis]|uniref:hypothetical protein n=1 Tax=Microvirga yunnanensis TaxID=2953740 RepID=UPI0021C7BDB8|nr:hypothetical protein [Microvirga sp. HBU65207]
MAGGSVIETAPLEDTSAASTARTFELGLRTSLPLTLRGLLLMEEMGMYARQIELIRETEASPPRPYAGIGKAWGEAELRVLKELRTRAERALAIEAEFGSGCLLNVEHPLVTAAVLSWKSITEAEVAKAREFQERHPGLYREFLLNQSASAEFS